MSLHYPIFWTPTEFILEEIKIFRDKMSTFKLKIPFDMDEYFPMYHLHFILSDEKYLDEIRAIQRQLSQDQLAFDTDPHKLTQRIEEIKKEYAEDAEKMGVVSFKNLSLVEYKKDSKDNTFLTFSLPTGLTEFILENIQKRPSEQIPVKIILNDASKNEYNHLSEDEEKTIFGNTRFCS